MARPGESVIVVRRTGDLPRHTARWSLLGAFSLLCAGNIFADAAPVMVLLTFLCLFFLWKSLPGNTVLDTSSRTVRVRESGWRTRTLSFDEIAGIHPVTRGTQTGFCLSLRSDPLFETLVISDMLDEENAYRREFSLQLLPRIERLLPPQPRPQIRPTEGQTRFARNGDKPERAERGHFPPGRYVLDPSRRVIEISGEGPFFESKTFSFDDLDAVCVKVDGRMKKSVYFRFKGEKRLRLAARGTPKELRETLASCALVMGVELSQKIEYIA